MAEPGVRDDPFALLGLPARPGLADEDVRAAWRRIAAATHPDRDDGGDPAVFGAAAAAYVTLRTSFGRGEALADLGDGTASVPARPPGRHGGRRGRVRHGRTRPGRVSRESSVPGLRDGLAGPGARLVAGVAEIAAFVARVAAVIVTGGRWRGLAVRVIAAGVAGAAAFLAAGWSPGTAGVLAGAVTCLTYPLIPRHRA